jgi:hypothetical protein
VLGEFPDISDDSLILPKWIEAAQKRTIKRNGRPVLAWDIARYGEDESVGMRREGGWVRVYRAHHKADTMTTTGHIVKAHRDIHAEKGLNDFPTHVVDVVGVGAGVYDRLVELSIPVVPYNGGEAFRQGALRQRSSGGLLEPARAVRGRHSGFDDEGVVADTLAMAMCRSRLLRQGSGPTGRHPAVLGGTTS